MPHVRAKGSIADCCFSSNVGNGSYNPKRFLNMGSAGRNDMFDERVSVRDTTTETLRIFFDEKKVAFDVKLIVSCG